MSTQQTKIKYLKIYSEEELESINFNNIEYSELEELHICNNDLIDINESIFNLKNLKKLCMFNNLIIYLPELIINLTKLEQINLDYKNIHSLSSYIEYLPNLKRINIIIDEYTFYNINIINIPEEIKQLQESKKVKVTLKFDKTRN